MGQKKHKPEEIVAKRRQVDVLVSQGRWPIRVLDRSMKGELGKGVNEGGIWAHVRDPRPWSGTAPPAVACHFSPDRKGEHPQ